MTGKRILVTGAGGFIAHHLSSYLVKKGYWVRGADQKRPEYSGTDAHEFYVMDLRDSKNCVAADDGTLRDHNVRRHLEKLGPQLREAFWDGMTIEQLTGYATAVRSRTAPRRPTIEEIWQDQTARWKRAQEAAG